MPQAKTAIRTPMRVAASHPQASMKSEIAMMARVRPGSCAPEVLNWSTTFGTTNVMSATMTTPATIERISG